MKWTKRRVAQLEKMRQLLIEASTLNHGSGVVQRIKRCEQLARELFESNLALTKQPASFHQFLVELAAKDRSDGDKQT